MHHAYACNISGWHSMRILHCSAKCEPCDHDHRYARCQGNLLARPPSQDSCQSKNWCAWPLGWIETVQVFLQFQVQSASSQSERNFLHRASAIGVHRGAASSLVLDARVRKFGSVGSKIHPHEGSHTGEHTRDNGTNSYELLPNSWKLFILGHLPIDPPSPKPKQNIWMYCKVLQATKQGMKGNVGSRFRFGMHLMHPHLRFSCPFLHQLSAELMESNQLCNSCRDRLSFCFVKHGQSFQSHYVLCITMYLRMGPGDHVFLS